MSSVHRIKVGQSVAQIVDGDGRVSPLPKPRTGAFRARCTCGWKSAEVGTELQAKRDGDAHVRIAEKAHHGGRS